MRFLHPIMGSRCVPLARTVLRHGGVSIGNVPMLGLAAALGILRWPNCVVESARVALSDRPRCAPPPVFLVGHWRSGTTFLHNLMSQDPRFCFPTLLEVLSPYEFFPSLLSRYSVPAVLGRLPPTRPMDQVPLRPDLPQEEEIALAAMDAASFLNCIYFPARMSQTFATEVLFDGASDAAVRRWRQVYDYFLRKLALRHPGKQLLLKNPANGARIALLRQMYPGARFVHIHRDPFSVYGSTLGLYQGLLQSLAMQDFDPLLLQEHILWSYARFTDAMLTQMQDLPAGDLIHVRYADLCARPVATVRSVYRALGLEWSASMTTAVEAFLARTLVRPADRAALHPQTAEAVRIRWARMFESFGYPEPQVARKSPDR